VHDAVVLDMLRPFDKEAIVFGIITRDRDVLAGEGADRLE
jgi:hypothetical protein